MTKINFIRGHDKVIAKLKKIQARHGKDDASVIVGYTQNYGIYVHEDMNARHPIGKAKFLEDPARRMAKELGQQIGQSMKRKVPAVNALVLAGLRLQKASQKEVPVDTSALKASAFTVEEKNYVIAPKQV